MRKWLTGYTCALICFFSSDAFAGQTSVTSLKTVLLSVNKEVCQGRIYTQAEDIVIISEGVFLNVGGRLLAVRNIGHDTNGLYAAWWNGDDEEDELWECQKCMTLNNMSRYRCKSCGWDRRN